MKFFHFFWSWIVYTYAKVRGYERMARVGEQQRRMKICVNCDFFAEGECHLCGCLCQAKVMLTTEKCPAKKWPRIWRKRVTIPSINGE